MQLLNLIPRPSTWHTCSILRHPKAETGEQALSLSVASFIQVLAIWLGDGKGFGIANKIGRPTHITHYTIQQPSESIMSFAHSVAK